MAEFLGGLVPQTNPSGATGVDSSRVGSLLSSGSASVLRYHMRGFDQNGAVNDYVYWDAPAVDPGASSYTGSAGPVVDVVVFDIKGD